MERIGLIASLVGASLAAAVAVLLPAACTQHHTPAPPASDTPIVRVRLLAGQERVTLRAAVTPTIKTASESAAIKLNVAPATDAELTLSPAGWVISGVKVPGRGELALWPGEDASVSINGRIYHGHYRFFPVSATMFDVVNDVDVDNYLKGVLARELLRSWSDETYLSQAIVARTYALYEVRTDGANRHWDLHPDQRSQMYGGVADETAKSRLAVEQTGGVVVAFGQPGQERIFKAYFSTCCGGVSQSAADTFGEPYSVPLSDLDVHGLCSPAPKYNWGPMEISKAELTRRLRAYGIKRDRGEKNMADVARLEVQFVNRFNRPIRFVAIDANGVRYSLTGEELRNAINGQATEDSPEKLYSSFVKVINDPGSDSIRFVEGHGNGHGVGMCQWCSEVRAQAGMRHEDIVLSAYPQTKLVRAY